MTILDAQCDYHGISEYSGAALLYLQAGWTSVLPIPHRKKIPPSEGTTGHAAPDPTAADHQERAEKRSGENLALRMPDGVIGIDIDAYGDKPGLETIAGLEAELGKLPDTWRSSSRTDGSEIRFYRVPPGSFLVSGLPGVETVQRGHRYAMAWPSTHPEDRTYYWFALVKTIRVRWRPSAGR